MKENKSSIEEGDHFKLVCRRRGVVDAETNTDITWTWTSAANGSVAQRFDGNETSWLPGSQVLFEKLNDFELSYIEWENVTANATGNYQCHHPLAGSSVIYKLEIACKSYF